MAKLHQTDADRARFGRAARQLVTKDERRAQKRRLQGHYEDDPQFQVTHGGTYVQGSTRHAGRTKGLPFSRCVLKHVIPAHPTRGPATLYLKHPTRGRKHVRQVTPELAKVFYPGFAANPFIADMLFGKH